LRRSGEPAPCRSGREGDIDFYAGCSNFLAPRFLQLYKTRPQMGADAVSQRAGAVPEIYVAGDRDMVVSFPRTDPCSQPQNCVPATVTSRLSPAAATDPAGESRRGNARSSTFHRGLPAKEMPRAALAPTVIEWRIRGARMDGCRRPMDTGPAAARVREAHGIRGSGGLCGASISKTLRLALSRHFTGFCGYRDDPRCFVHADWWQRLSRSDATTGQRILVLACLWRLSDGPFSAHVGWERCRIVRAQAGPHRLHVHRGALLDSLGIELPALACSHVAADRGLAESKYRQRRVRSRRGQAR